MVSQDGTAELLQHLERFETRLESAVASGYPNLRQALSELRQDVEALRPLGVTTVAEQLGALADSASAVQGVVRVGLVLHASRLLRLRLGQDAPPMAAQPAGRRPAEVARILPISRLRLGGEELWTAVRLRGKSPEMLMLLEPCPLPEGVQPWLGGYHLVRGTPAWQARYPFEHVVVDRWSMPADVRVQATTEMREDPLASFRQSLAAGTLQAGTSVVGSAWSLRCGNAASLDRTRLLWLDPSLEALIAPRLEHLPQAVWVVYWSVPGRDIPLCLLQALPGGQAAVLHPT